MKVQGVTVDSDVGQRPRVRGMQTPQKHPPGHQPDSKRKKNVFRSCGWYGCLKYPYATIVPDRRPGNFGFPAGFVFF